MLFVSVTAHLLYELVYTYIGKGPATMHRSSRLPCIVYFTRRHLLGCVFYLSFFLLFSSKRFLERFLPMDMLATYPK